VNPTSESNGINWLRGDGSFCAPRWVWIDSLSKFTMTQWEGDTGVNAVPVVNSVEGVLGLEVSLPQDVS